MGSFAFFNAVYLVYMSQHLSQAQIWILRMPCRWACYSCLCSVSLIWCYEYVSPYAGWFLGPSSSPNAYVGNTVPTEISSQPISVFLKHDLNELTNCRSEFYCLSIVFTFCPHYRIQRLWYVKHFLILLLSIINEEATKYIISICFFCHLVVTWMMLRRWEVIFPSLTILPISCVNDFLVDVWIWNHDFILNRWNSLSRVVSREFLSFYVPLKWRKVHKRLQSLEEHHFYPADAVKTSWFLTLLEIIDLSSALLQEIEDS